MAAFVSNRLPTCFIQTLFQMYMNNDTFAHMKQIYITYSFTKLIFKYVTVESERCFQIKSPLGGAKSTSKF